jgi:acetolactate synthase-1/2/3 large subunit
VIPAVAHAAAHDGPVLLDIRVESDDAVYPMVAAGAGLDQMIRRPAQEAIR